MRSATGALAVAAEQLTVPPVRGPAPALVESGVLRQWWGDGAWDRLAPIVEQLARTVAYRMLRDDDDAADVAQRVVIRCWRMTIVPDRPATFVAQVARNLTLDRLKRGAAKHETPMGDFDVETPELGALTTMVQDEDRARLRVALRDVPDALRRPLILQTFHRRTIPQLAEQFHTTDGAMKMRLSRARRVLRRTWVAACAAESSAVYIAQVATVRRSQSAGC